MTRAIRPRPYIFCVRDSRPHRRFSRLAPSPLFQARFATTLRSYDNWNSLDHTAPMIGPDKPLNFSAAARKCDSRHSEQPESQLVRFLHAKCEIPKPETGFRFRAMAISMAQVRRWSKVREDSCATREHSPRGDDQTSVTNRRRHFNF